jgi:hypothetical protein
MWEAPCQAVEKAEVRAGVREAEGDWVEGVALAEVETAEAAEMAEGATAEGADWVAEEGAGAGGDSAAAAMQGFRIQGSVNWSLRIRFSV